MKKILIVSMMTVLVLSGLAWAGTGTENDPYTIAEAIALPEGATEYWAQGYIAGGAYNNFDSPWTSDYSISCADTDSESDVDNCLQVKLESDGGRTTWGLSSNAGNYQKLIKFQGFRDAYGSKPSFEGVDNADISEVALENQPPVLATVGNKSVIWSNTLTFTVSASDTLDGDEISLSATDLPAGATFVGATNASTASSTFTWADAGPMGSYEMTFSATDKDGTSSETITINVGDGSSPADIAWQGFENTASDTWTILDGDDAASSEPGSADIPLNQRIRTDTTSWQPGTIDETSVDLELDTVDVSTWSDVMIELHMSATCTNYSDGYGMYPSDTVSFFVALDGGDYGSADLVVAGNSETADGIEGVLWPMDATGIAATTAGVSRTVAPSAGGVVDDGLATVQIYIPAGTTSLKFKASVAQEYYGYFWNIDDIALNGVNDGGATDLPPTISISPDGLDKSVAVSNNVSFTISGSEIPNDAGDEMRIWATDLPVGATFAGTTNSGSASSEFSWTPTEAGATTVHFFVGDKDGTNELDVVITAYDLSAGGAAYALTVGLNEYDSSYISSGNWLNGCVPDANHVFTNILKRGEWNALTAEKKEDSAGTKAAIRAAITSYASTAVAGDTFLYYHSSHGGQNSGTSVYLCTYDDDYQDTELASDLSQFAAGVKVVVMVDACHSGGLFKSVEANTRAVRSATGGWNLAGIVSGIMDEQRTAKLAAGKRDVLSRVSSDEIGWITAADYDQYSWDGGPNGGGIFTDKLIEGWTNAVATSCDLDGDAYANFYELWDYSWDVVAYDSDYENTTAMSYNTNVLLSTMAGWIGDTAPVTSNQPPSIVLNPAGLSKTVEFDEPLSFTVTATDIDGEAVSLVVSNLPSGATAPDDSGTGTASTTFNWTPAEAQIGSYDVTFTATDADGTTTTTVQISVTEPVVLIPVASVANVSSNSFTLNWTATTGGTTYQVQVDTNGAFTADQGDNLLSNGGFEMGDNTDWDKFESGYTVVTTSPQEGSYAVECIAGSTRDLMQAVDITGDGVTEYEISYYYRVTAGDGADVRIWASWALGGQDSGDELQVNADYNADTSEWTKMTYHVVPSAGANTLNFEIRCYNGSTVYLDNFFVGVAGVARAPKAILVDQSVSALTLDVTGLEAATPYYARVRPTAGAWSDTVMATTTSGGVPVPPDPQPISALVSPTNGMLSLEIPTQIGTTYAMECSSNLWATPQIWIQVGTSIAGTGANIVFEDADPSDVKCYYRIVAP